MSKKSSPIKVDINTAEDYTWYDDHAGCAVVLTIVGGIFLAGAAAGLLAAWMIVR